MSNQMRLEKEQTKKENSQIKENRDPLTDNGKKKGKEERPATKVVVRRLPPSMTQELFVEQVSPLPPTDYMYFVQADMSLTPHCFSRAYLNFMNQEDLFIFTQKFDNYVFVDSKGQEYPAVVEFAPFQRIPKHRPNRKKDPKMNTLETDPIFISFKEKLEAEMLENKSAANAVKQHFFETSAATAEKKEITTPLLDFIKNRRVERQRMRDEKREEKRKKDLERRRAKDEQRKTKKDDDSPVVKVLHSPVVNKEKPKESRNSSRNSVTKKRIDEIKSPKDKGSTELRSRENKNRIGKSYQEERQRQAERREELRRKTSTLSRSQSSLSESKTSLNESKEETDKTKSSYSEEKSTISERRIRDSERRKSDRNYRKDEIRKPTSRSDGRRDMEETARRRNGKTNELRPLSRKEDDKKDEFGGRRRTSDIKRNSEYSNVDRNKDRVRGKPPGKKNLDLSTDTGKQSDKSIKEKKSDLKDIETKVEDAVNDRLCNSVTVSEEGNKLETKSRNCFESEKNVNKRRSSLESGTINNENISDIDNKSDQNDKKRRNSLDSPNNLLDSGGEILTKVKKTLKESFIKELSLQKTNTDDKESKTDIDKVENYEPELPKRRKSMEERRVDCSKELTNSDKRKHVNRRNSLESGDHRQHSERLEKIHKNKENEDREGENEGQKRNKDPRTVRRIRNKDRPTLEIYRPGMGRFSKQRLEREKVLGSSTEVESPSSSPSPTPVSKPKSALTREH